MENHRPENSAGVRVPERSNAANSEGQAESRQVNENGKEKEEENKYNLEAVSEDVERFMLNLVSPIVEKGNDSADLEIPHCVEKYLGLIGEQISIYESPEKKASQLPEENAVFFKAVDQLSKLHKNLSESFKLDSKHGHLISRMGRIQQRAMTCLEDEFRSLLEDYSKFLEPEPEPEEKLQECYENCGQDQIDQANEESKFPGYSQEILDSLNSIAKLMISGGYESECCEVYTLTRRNAIEEMLQEIGLEKISIDEAHKMQWEALEREIPPWIRAFKQGANLYFPGEHKLAGSIFSDYPSLSASLFSNLTRGVVIQLLNFAEAVAIAKRSTEKLFKFLDIYETLRDNLSTVCGLFPEECAKELKAETITTRCRIGETVVCTFCDLEHSIKSDTGNTPVPGGAVHPLTRYTMNYLKYVGEYKDTLEQVFKDHSKMETNDSMNRRHEGNHSQKEENLSAFAMQLLRIMELLDTTLEAKSKLYKEISLSCIFMMNNGRYMLQKIKGSTEIYQVVGETWCRKRSSDLRNYHKSYQRETWSKLLGCLTHEGLNVNGKVLKPVLKERFKSFNSMFDEIHKTQSSWVVSDEQLQSELKISISAVVIPAYRSFIGRFSGYLDPGRQTEKYIKFQADDVENYIDDLFEGNAIKGK